MQAIHFSSMRIEIEKSVSSQPVSVLLFYVIVDFLEFRICKNLQDDDG